MRPSDSGIMYYYEEIVDQDLEASNSNPAAPISSHDTSMFWNLNHRMDNTERQTKELSSQSERQLRLIQAITKSQNQHELEQREAMGALLGRIERNEEKIEGFQRVTQALSANQVQTAEEVRALQAELIELKKELQAQKIREEQQQQFQNHQGIPFENMMKMKQKIAAAAKTLKTLTTEQRQEETIVTSPAAGKTFTDVYGRKRKLCRYCGENFSATYVNEHERNQVCRRENGKRRRQRQPSPSSSNNSDNDDSRLVIEEVEN